MTIRTATVSDQDSVLELLDEFRADCIEQITGNPAESNTARTGGIKLYQTVLNRSDYCLLLLENEDLRIVGIITGYLCPMLRSGEVRAEVEEFFIKKEFRGKDNAKKLMDAFFSWCKKNHVNKVNLESDKQLGRAHHFYKKYGFETKAERFVKKID